MTQLRKEVIMSTNKDRRRVMNSDSKKSWNGDFSKYYLFSNVEISGYSGYQVALFEVDFNNNTITLIKNIPEIRQSNNIEIYPVTVVGDYAIVHMAGYLSTEYLLKYNLSTNTYSYETENRSSTRTMYTPIGYYLDTEVQFYKRYRSYLDGKYTRSGSSLGYSIGGSNEIIDIITDSNMQTFRDKLESLNSIRCDFTDVIYYNGYYYFFTEGQYSSIRVPEGSISDSTNFINDMELVFIGSGSYWNYSDYGRSGWNYSEFSKIGFKDGVIYSWYSNGGDYDDSCYLYTYDLNTQGIGSNMVSTGRSYYSNGPVTANVKVGIETNLDIISIYSYDTDGSYYLTYLDKPIGNVRLRDESSKGSSIIYNLVGDKLLTSRYIPSTNNDLTDGMYYINLSSIDLNQTGSNININPTKLTVNNGDNLQFNGYYNRFFGVR